MFAGENPDAIREGVRSLSPTVRKSSGRRKKQGKSVSVASPNSKQALGMDVRTIKDATGKLIGPELYAGGQKPEGQWPRTGSDKTPVAKVSFVTKAGDLGCGVGYYK
jgi:hypothetical protein